MFLLCDTVKGNGWVATVPARAEGGGGLHHAHEAPNDAQCVPIRAGLKAPTVPFVTAACCRPEGVSQLNSCRLILWLWTSLFVFGFSRVFFSKKTGSEVLA